jgi:hypothetical protein
LVFFFFFSFPFFLPKIMCWPCEKSYQPINLFIFFGFSPSSIICNFLYLHWLFLIGLYIWFHHWSFDFWIFFFKFGIHYELLFVLFWIIFLIDVFFTILPLDIYFHLLFASNSAMLFSNYFLNGLVF